LAKFEIILGLLAIYLFFYLDSPHNTIVAGIALFKIAGLQVKFDKIIPNIWFDLVLTCYLFFLGEVFIAILVLLMGRLRDFLFTIVPGEEQDKEYWEGNRFREE
jgi:hypothetical protein